MVGAVDVRMLFSLRTSEGVRKPELVFVKQEWRSGRRD